MSKWNIISDRRNKKQVYNDEYVLKNDYLNILIEMNVRKQVGCDVEWIKLA
jgi:hypothetical protein